MWLAIGALASMFLSGLIKNFFTRRAQENEYELKSNLMEQQAGLNKEQYDYEYMKESPAARVQQYQAAGLNPALMYSNGVAGMQGSVGSVSVPSFGSYNSSLSDFADVMQSLSTSREKEGQTDPSKVQMENLKSLTNLNEANKAVAEALPDKIKAETDATAFSTHLAKALESTTIETAKKELDIAVESYNKLQEQVRQLKEQNKVLPDKLKNDLKAQEQSLALGKIDLYLKETYGEKEARKQLSLADAMIQHFYSEIDVNKERLPQIRELARKYSEDADYRALVNTKLEEYGLDISKSGYAGQAERLAVALGDILKDIRSNW